MTPDELSKEAERFCRVLAIWEGKPAQHIMALENIKNALRTVHDAALEEGRNEIRKACTQHQHEQYRDGFNEAIERAAETSKQAVLDHDNRMLAEGAGWNLDAEQRFIEDKIRALKIGGENEQTGL